MLEFEWDSGKAASNFDKHGVSFDEAGSVFADPLSLAIPDPYHSELEFRYLILGLSDRGRLLVVSHTDRGAKIRLIGVGWRIAGNGAIMNDDDKADIKDEYDFSGGVRGKYAKRVAGGTNLVRLDPDVARAFPDSDAVNKALRSVMARQSSDTE